MRVSYVDTNPLFTKFYFMQRIKIMPVGEPVGFTDRRIDSTNKTRKKILLAQRLKKELAKKEITSSDFARKLNRKQPEISRWLSGRHNFTIDTLFEIESALNITLVCGQEDNGAGAVKVPIRTIVRHKPIAPQASIKQKTLQILSSQQLTHSSKSRLTVAN